MAQTHSRNAELAVRAITLLGERDFPALREIMADDMTAQGPYHPNGAAFFAGADVAMKDFKQLRAFDTFTLSVIDVFDTGGDTVIVEARSHGTHKDETRPIYANHYLFVLSVQDGKVILWREFYNPLEAMKQGYGRAEISR